MTAELDPAIAKAAHEIVMDAVDADKLSASDADDAEQELLLAAWESLQPERRDQRNGKYKARQLASYDPLKPNATTPLNWAIKAMLGRLTNWQRDEYEGQRAFDRSMTDADGLDVEDIGKVQHLRPTPRQLREYAADPRLDDPQ